MIVNKKIILYIILLGILTLTVVNAQTRFYSETLRSLYNSLPEICKQDSAINCKEIVLCDTVKLNYQIDDCGFIVHIGYKFFNDIYSLEDNRYIFQFLEREFLKWVISTNEDEILLKYEIDNVLVEYNGNPINVSFLKNKNDLVSFLNKTSEFHSVKINNRYFINITNFDKNIIAFNFPNNENLISGMNKKERDDLIYNQLRNHNASIDYKYDIDTTNIEIINDSIFIHYGSYYLIPEINNNIFIQREDSVFHIILNNYKFLNETFINTMLGLSYISYEYNIKHVKYGYDIVDYTVCSKNFYDYFSIGYNRYFGVETSSEDNLSGTLIFQNKDSEYVHLAYMQCTLDGLVNDNKIEVKLYTNIPRTSLVNLFGEIEEFTK